MPLMVLRPNKSKIARNFLGTLAKNRQWTMSYLFCGYFQVWSNIESSMCCLNSRKLLLWIECRKNDDTIFGWVEMILVKSGKNQWNWNVEIVIKTHSTWVLCDKKKFEKHLIEFDLIPLKNLSPKVFTFSSLRLDKFQNTRCYSMSSTIHVYKFCLNLWKGSWWRVRDIMYVW